VQSKSPATCVSKSSSAADDPYIVVRILSRQFVQAADPSKACAQWPWMIRQYEVVSFMQGRSEFLVGCPTHQDEACRRLIVEVGSIAGKLPRDARVGRDAPSNIDGCDKSDHVNSPNRRRQEALSASYTEGRKPLKSRAVTAER
jgi:hypothetical protein